MGCGGPREPIPLGKVGDGLRKRFGAVYNGSMRKTFSMEAMVVRRKGFFVFLLVCGVLLWGTQISGISWDADMGVVLVQLDSFPANWGEWKMQLDGREVSMEGGIHGVAVRPNAPLDKPPTGLIIGSLPWVSGLEESGFPCCGTLRFFIPGEGWTNEAAFNFVVFGCKTISSKACPQEWSTHRGLLEVQPGSDFLLDGQKFLQLGNVVVQPGARMVLRDAQFLQGRGDVPTVHTYIYVEPGATLEIIRSTIAPSEPFGGLLCIRNSGTLRIIDSPTSIHLLEMAKGAQLEMVNSSMVFEIGGLLQLAGGDSHLVNSTIGALALNVPANARLRVSGLESGGTFAHFDVRDWIPDADYSLVMENSRVLADDWTGELEHGPYERGWIFFLHPDADATIRDAELRKVFLEVDGGKACFENLKISQPVSLHYRNIALQDVVVKGQWPIAVHDANVTVKNSAYLFFQPSGNSEVTFVDSHICEFIPRDFFGSVHFQNGVWSIAGEIIGGEPGHSMGNDFTITGSLRISPEVQNSLQWKNAQVTREFPLLVLDSAGNPVQNARVVVHGVQVQTDALGNATISVVFDEHNYNQPHLVQVIRPGKAPQTISIDFFTTTPIRVEPE